MAKENQIELLKSLVLKEVDAFHQQCESIWNAVAEVTDVIRANHWRAVLFGGAIRSLLVSRMVYRRAGRPRDVDLVVQGVSLEKLHQQFQSLVTRETRFGGLQLRKSDWLFDLWPLERTWAFVEDKVHQPLFSDLPQTTFLNMEAIAIDVWPNQGQLREIYSGDDQFFRGVIDRVVEINRAENPFPELCVIRSLVMANDLGFRIGVQLARYIAERGLTISLDDLEQIQIKHYGHIRVSGMVLRNWARFLSDALDLEPEGSIRLPSKLDPNLRNSLPLIAT